MKKKWFRSILRRRIVVVLLLLLQVAFLSCLFIYRTRSVMYVSESIRILALLLTLRVIYVPNNGTTKTVWIFLLLLFPAAGSILYLMVYLQGASRRYSKAIAEIDRDTRQYYVLPAPAKEAAVRDNPACKTDIAYLQDRMGFPVYDASEATYYSPGEAFFPDYLDALRKAEHYIFLEYFIIGEGECWSQILDILKEKAAQGVDVRVMYDDLGCFVTLPKDFRKTMEGYGIRCVVFNPFIPTLSAIQNNRDHRKITSIDGKVAFTGGLNLADEYMNRYEKYGYWKDAALRLEGKAAWSFTLMFLQMWRLCTHTEEDILSFYPDGELYPQKSAGYVQPYADSPLDTETVGEQVYLKLIHGARDYLYITTPYLIIDESMVSALTLAAKSGVDVRIITPRIYDKFLVHCTTRSYYRQLIAGGVRIYEYSIGFIHSKNFVADDCVATVGTVNLDFRSLYQQFECGAVLYSAPAVAQVRDDFLQTLEQCREVTLEDSRSSAFGRLLQELLRLFSPLM